MFIKKYLLFVFEPFDYKKYIQKLRPFLRTVVMAFSFVIFSSYQVNAWDRWGISYSGDSSIGNYIWTIDDSTGVSTKVSTKLFDTNGWQPGTSYVDQKTGDLVIKSGGGVLHSYNLDSDTWTDISNPDVGMQGTFQRVTGIDTIATKASDDTISIQSGTGKVKINGGILADSSGDTIIASDSDGVITLGGVAKITEGAIADSSGVNIIKKDSDGAIHLGENSFVTREYGGHQEIYATNAAGSAIDLNVTNGSDLLVNGTSVMGSIRGLADGVRGTTAMSAALSSVPAMSGDREFECGVGVGSYSSKQALAMSCGARFDDQITANFGASFLPGGSQSYLLGEMDAVVLRAGISFKFGKSYASSSANKMSALNDDTFNSYQLSEAQREVDGLRNKVASLESFKAAEVADKAAEVAEMKSLKAEIAEMKLMMAGLLGNRVVAMR
jgi:hypothetical protein